MEKVSPVVWVCLDDPREDGDLYAKFPDIHTALDEVQTHVPRDVEGPEFESMADLIDRGYGEIVAFRDHKDLNPGMASRMDRLVDRLRASEDSTSVGNDVFRLVEELDAHLQRHEDGDLEEIVVKLKRMRDRDLGPYDLALHNSSGDCEVNPLRMMLSLFLDGLGSHGCQFQVGDAIFWTRRSGFRVSPEEDGRLLPDWAREVLDAPNSIGPFGPYREERYRTDPRTWNIGGSEDWSAFWTDDDGEQTSLRTDGLFVGGW